MSSSPAKRSRLAHSPRPPAHLISLNSPYSFCGLAPCLWPMFPEARAALAEWVLNGPKKGPARKSLRPVLGMFRRNLAALSGFFFFLARRPRSLKPNVSQLENLSGCCRYSDGAGQILFEFFVTLWRVPPIGTVNETHSGPASVGRPRLLPQIRCGSPKTI